MIVHNRLCGCVCVCVSPTEKLFTMVRTSFISTALYCVIFCIASPPLGQTPELNNGLYPSLYQAPKKAKKKTAEGGSNVFSMFEQSQIQEFKEVDPR